MPSGNGRTSTGKRPAPRPPRSLGTRFPRSSVCRRYSKSSAKTYRGPAQDFVFAALKLAVDEHETWTAPVTVLYRRAAANVGALCKAFETFGLSSEVGCH